MAHVPGFRVHCWGGISIVYVYVDVHVFVCMCLCVYAFVCVLFILAQDAMKTQGVMLVPISGR